MNLNDLASFVHVVELGTISAAAKAEGVPKSTISRRIARLEDELGVELLRRSARSFALTDDGRMLHARSVAAVQELSDVATRLHECSEVPRGTLVITAPPDIAGSAGFATLLTEYRRSCPEVRVEVRLESRVIDLQREGVDVALRGHEGEIPGEAGLMSRSLGSARGGFYASPRYLAVHGTPSTPAELSEHALVLHEILVGRPLTLASAVGAQTVKLSSPAFVLNEFGLAQRLIEAGAGIGMLAAAWARPSLAAGLIGEVLPGWSIHLGRMSLVWPASRQLAPSVRRFVTLVTQRLALLTMIDEL
ncbi:LysR family transcriptional regulator [Enhygromyxa salina]|uniref:HTH-type transcriptional regulator DmlR n=1 Tax=Enhygromyxa salina TaxID=215803 RepID=A0A2S9YPC9_9BACT|nr:LysR family transcriptional regulator [Enhygromyxa salina]PRQ06947.1 HTH-type transcriptional regulator DmlR [Enhygromyxa salina]